MRRKFITKLLSLVALMLSSCSITNLFSGTHIETVFIKNKQAQIFVDQEVQLNVEILPQSAGNQDIIWKSSDNKIASVDDYGLLKGIKEGSTKIEVYSAKDSSISDSFNIEVKEPELQSISIKTQPTKLTYVENEKFDPSGLVLNVEYENGKTKSVEYNSNKYDFTFTPSLDTSLTKRNEIVTLKYKGKTLDIEITVSEATPEEFTKTKLQYTYDDYQANSYVGNSDNCPLVGNPKLLIIPIWFNDSDNFISPSKKDSVREDIELAYIGSKADTGWNSVKTYYETESFGKITLSATVTDWYEINKSYTTYGPEIAVYQTADLVTSASDAYFTNHPSDSRRNYDSNNDGYLDGVMLIYAAPDYDSLNDDSLSNLWAYCFWTYAEKNITSPTANVFFWASYDFLYGDDALERTGQSSYHRGYTEHGVTVDTHCLIHEMGHVLGLQDYYDYSNQYSPAGGFSMQDYNVGGHDPYSVMAYGWLDPYIPKESMTITIGDFQSTHDVILLANHDVTVSPFDEYLLLEYYTPTGLNEFDSTYAYRGGYPTGSSVPGIRLWHVDARLFRNSPNIRNITTLPTSNVYHVMSNSYGSSHGSMFGSSYYNYNLLQLIRNDVGSSYTPTDYLSASKLFQARDSFNMSTFSEQFVNGTNMNDGKALGWSFRVDSITSNKATITLTKA